MPDEPPTPFEPATAFLPGSGKRPESTCCRDFVSFVGIHRCSIWGLCRGFSVAFCLRHCGAAWGAGLDLAWARFASRPGPSLPGLSDPGYRARLLVGLYYELGGGRLVLVLRDPVENASFMALLVGTALIHSLAGDGKTRGIQKLDRCLAGPIATSLKACRALSWCAPGC